MELPKEARTVERLVQQYYEALYRYAFRLSGSATDAEDLVQEAFCKAQANIRQLREPGKAKAWLFRILRNAYLYRARLERRRRYVSLENLDSLPELHPDELPAIDAQQLQEALNEIPEAFRTPVILYYFDEFSYRDIAEQMDLPLGTVMSRLARAKTYLRAKLLRPAPSLAERPRRTSDGL